MLNISNNFLIVFSFGFFWFVICAVFLAILLIVLISFAIVTEIFKKKYIKAYNEVNEIDD